MPCKPVRVPFPCIYKFKNAPISSVYPPQKHPSRYVQTNDLCFNSDIFLQELYKNVQLSDPFHVIVKGVYPRKKYSPTVFIPIGEFLVSD